MEWLFLLLPVAAFSGWLAARSHYKSRYQQTKSPFNPDYFKGLNFLLNEQPDKAINVFISLLEVNSETVETHLALANLFRRRGETDRAIRIHQNLIARPTLSSQQRDNALIELGLDYMHAGVLDRAEQLFLELANKSSPAIQALEQLLRIYQQEKEWDKAIEIAKKIPVSHQKNIRSMIAQFYCELAQRQLTHSKKNASLYIQYATKYDRNCVRASLLEANVLINNSQHRKALKCLHRIEVQNHLYLAEALSLLLVCYQQINDLAAFEIWLKSTLNHHPNMTSVRLMLTTIIQLQYGKQQAQDYLHQQLQTYPSVEGLQSLVILSEHSQTTLIPLIKDITYNLIKTSHRYTCNNCGFSGKAMHWQCPSCQQWATVRPTENNLPPLLESS